MRQRTKCAVRAGMAIATHYRHARQGRTLLWSNHMNNALVSVLKRKINQRTSFFNIAVKRFYLQTRNWIFNALRPIFGRRIMVRVGHNSITAPRFAISQSQTFKCLRAGHFVHQMSVDIN